MYKGAGADRLLLIYNNYQRRNEAYYDAFIMDCCFRNDSTAD